MGAFMRRVIRAMVRRARDGDVEAVAELSRLRGDVAEAYRQAGAAAVEFGYTYGDLSRHLGISRQAAQQAFSVSVPQVGDHAVDPGQGGPGVPAVGGVGHPL